MRRSHVDPVLVGLDLNSSRARVVSGTPSSLVGSVALEEAGDELPLAVSLDSRRPEVGRAGVSLCRLSPHLVCQNYLASLGGAAEWHVGRHRLDAAQLVALVWDRVQQACAGARGMTLCLPGYLKPGQVAQLAQLAAKKKLTVLGSVATPLVAVLAAHVQEPLTGLALVVDVDDHALTIAAVAVDDEQARLVGHTCLPRLRHLAWVNCLIDAVADRCVRHSRRDPRDSAPAEQSLYEQMQDALDACRRGRPAQLGIRASQWFQNLLLQPEEMAGFCSRLVRQAAQAADELVRDVAFQAPTAVVLTDAASRLPGMLAALGGMAERPEPALEATSAEDFGEDLVPAEVEQGRVVVLAAESLARTAHGLAERMFRGDLAREHHASAVPFGQAASADLGPARLQYRDQYYPLQGTSFTLGRQASCDLVFDSAYYPMVSGRHCEIVLERRGFFVRDRSRNGTWLNDQPVTQPTPLRPGDWIRLGPDGPLLRFLGRANDARQLGTTA
jgi:hypothetical protein